VWYWSILLMSATRRHWRSAFAKHKFLPLGFTSPPLGQQSAKVYKSIQKKKKELFTAIKSNKIKQQHNFFQSWYFSISPIWLRKKCIKHISNCTMWKRFHESFTKIHRLLQSAFADVLSKTMQDNRLSGLALL